MLVNLVSYDKKTRERVRICKFIILSTTIICMGVAQTFNKINVMILIFVVVSTVYQNTRSTPFHAYY